MRRLTAAGFHINLGLLILFSKVAESGTIAAAAKSLNMLPSVATRKIAALEAAMKTRLFERTTRRIHLTEAGVLALKWTNEVIAGHLTLEDRIATLQGSPSGTLRLIVNEYICSSVLPGFLSGFCKRYPEIKVALTVTDKLVDVDDRNYDVAIHSGCIPDSQLIGIRIASVERILCASPAYLKRRGVPHSLDDLKDHDYLEHRENSGCDWVFAGNGAVVRQELPFLVQADSYLPLIEFARAGLGIVCISRESIRKDLESGDLVHLLPGIISTHSHRSNPGTWIMYPKGSKLRRSRIFISEFREFIKELRY